MRYGPASLESKNYSNDVLPLPYTNLCQRNMWNVSDHGASETPTGSASPDTNYAGTGVLSVERTHPTVERGNSPISSLTYNIEMNEDELLLYALMRVVFPKQTFTKGHNLQSYKAISHALCTVCGVHYSPPAIRQFFYNIRQGKLKHYAKIQNKMRWNYYKRRVDKFLEDQRDIVSKIARNTSLLQEEDIDVLSVALHKICTEAETIEDKEFRIDTFPLEITENHEFSNWKSYTDKRGDLHLYLFGEVPGYCKYEIIISNETKSWELYSDGIQKQDVLQWAGIQNTICTVGSVIKLMKVVQESFECQAIDYEKFKGIINNMYDPVFKTKEGQPAAFVECLQSDLRKNVIRSTSCTIFLPNGSDVSEAPKQCAGCQHAEHYLRTLKSVRNKQRDTNSNDNSKHTRHDYKSREELLQTIRALAEKLRVLKQKSDRSEDH